ncbi:HK97 gp10 family phage protein [Hominenteromicrobium sp.]|uniref:HK97 gp10 family phage protein n=1 Tax=Hominenteromicrobium sp. TaxID=3073581 RepID=UPI003AF19CA2
MARKIPLNELEAEIVKELKAYSDEVAEGIKKAVNDVAKETVRTLKTTSPRDTGKYARGWTFKVEFESPEDIRVRISNRTKWQLTHLLENGHAKVNGGRVDGKPHIRLAEQAAADKLVGAVKVVIKK